MNKPIVSVIVPVYNEVNYIEPMVHSVLSQQQKNFTLELLVVDGGSDDGTREKIYKLQKIHPTIQVIINEKKITPAAFNKGIEKASGEYIAILGAHSKYDTDYLDICIEEIEQNNCIACSGKVEVAKNSRSWKSILIYYMLTSNFGVSSKSYRTIKEGIGEQCPYPVFKRSVFKDVGLYNEALIRNQDNDMNYRIRQKGHKLYYTHKVSAYYYPKQTLGGLMDYAFRTGKWNAVSLRVNYNSLALRHIVPLFFSLALLVNIILIALSALFFASSAKFFVISICIIVCLHLIVGLIESIRYFIESKLTIVFVLPFLFFSFHFCYGWGTIVELAQKKLIAH